MDPEEKSRSRTEFQLSKKRANLQEGLRQLIADPRLPPVASWFVTDTNGTMLAAAFVQTPSKNVIGDNFAHRSYFHGGVMDDPADIAVAKPPLEVSKLSAPFKSTATETYKVAISCPVRDEVDDMLGVMVMTFELGQFVKFPTSNDLCAVLIDGRQDNYRGLILQHPLYDSLLRQHGKLPIVIDKEEYAVNVDELRIEESDSESAASELTSDKFYEDPLSRHKLGEAYEGDWIVATSPVSFARSHGEDAEVYDTGLLLLVQRRLRSATEPVRTLAGLLFREAIAAIAVVSLLSVALWYFTRRMLGVSFSDRRDGAWTGGDTSSLSSVSSGSMHTRETLEMPEGDSPSTETPRGAEAAADGKAGS